MKDGPLMTVLTRCFSNREQSALQSLSIADAHTHIHTAVTSEFTKKNNNKFKCDQRKIVFYLFFAEVSGHINAGDKTDFK